MVISSNFFIKIPPFLLSSTTIFDSESDSSIVNSPVRIRNLIFLRSSSAFPAQWITKEFFGTKNGLPKLGKPFFCFVIKLQSKTISKADYFKILEITPEPTVLPPSRIAKRRPSSIATGLITTTFMLMLSPGITISTPSGSSIAPVTSVVLMKN